MLRGHKGHAGESESDPLIGDRMSEETPNVVDITVLNMKLG